MMWISAIILGLTCIGSQADDHRTSSPRCDCDHTLLYCSVFHFGDKLNYHVQPSSSGNKLVSPLALYQSMIALSEAARKDSRATFTDVLFSLKEEKDCDALKKTRNTFKMLLNSVKPKVVQTVSRLVTQKGLQMEKSVLQAINALYQTEVKTVNYRRPKHTASSINKLVEEHTDHKIKDIVIAKNISKNSTLVVVNALHFKDEWMVPFESVNKEDFFIIKSETQPKKVDMMTVVGTFGFRQINDTHIVALDFKTPKYKLNLVYPTAPSINDVDMYDLLDPNKLNKTRLLVKVPKFRIESNHYNLMNVVQNMGIDLTDLSGLDGKGKIKIDDIRQKVYIDVNEMGVDEVPAQDKNKDNKTEDNSPHEKELIFNRPFRFYLTLHDVVALQGDVEDPTSSIESP